MNNCKREMTADDLEAAYNAYTAGFMKYLMASGVDESSAKDIVQDSFLELWSSREKLYATECIYSFWFKILRHRMLDEFRSRKRLVPLMPEIHEKSCESSELDGDLLYFRQRIADALNSLPTEVAECYKMAKIAGFSIRMIMKINGISEETVKGRIFRAKQKLMVLLADIKKNN